MHLTEKLSFCQQIQLRSVEKHPSSRARPLFNVAEHFIFVEHHFSALRSTLFSWNTTFHRCRALYFRGTPLFIVAEHFIFVEYHFSALQSTLFLWNTTFQRCRAPFHLWKTTFQRCKAFFHHWKTTFQRCIAYL